MENRRTLILPSQLGEIQTPEQELAGTAQASALSKAARFDPTFSTDTFLASSEWSSKNANDNAQMRVSISTALWPTPRWPQHGKKRHAHAVIRSWLR